MNFYATFSNDLKDYKKGNKEKEVILCEDRLKARDVQSGEGFTHT